MRGSGVVVFHGVRSRCARRGLAACTGAATVLSLAATPALGRAGGSGSQEMSFELLMNTGDSVEGVDFPVSFFMSMAVNNRGQHAIMGRALGPDNTVPQQWFILNDQQLLMSPHMTNLPVEIDGQTGLARLRSIQGVLDMNNRGDVVTPALPTNFAVPGEVSPQGVYIASRNGTVDRVVSVDEPLPWWTGGVGDFANVGFRPRISDDDRVLIEGNATPLGGSSVTNVSRFDRTPGSVPGSSDFVHTNVAAHGMPVAGGVYIGGGFASTMASNGRIVLSSVASLPAPNGFGFTLFDDGFPVLQEKQPSPVPGYFIQDIYAAATNNDGSTTMGMGLSLVPGGEEVERILFNTTRGVITATPGLGLGVPTPVPGGLGSTFSVDHHGNTYVLQSRLMPGGDVIDALWKNSEPLIPLGMDIGDGRTITSFGSHLDVSDNGRWIVVSAGLSDGSVGPLKMYVPVPGMAAMLALSAPVLVGRRRRASRGSAKHL